MAEPPARVVDPEAKLSAVYAAHYVQSEEVPAETPNAVPCFNCGVCVAHAQVTDKEALCPVCWNMLQASIKRAIRCGFRIG